MTNPPKISLAMIARDRARELSRALTCVKDHVDEIIVVDAGGSTDGTQEVVRRFGGKLIEFLPSQYPEAFYDDVKENFAKYEIPEPFTGRKGLRDFSVPRNVSFSACTGDVIFWIDSDDTVRGIEHLRRIVDEMFEKNLESIFFQYEYERDDKGRCTVRQIRERLIRRSDFESGRVTWQQPIHEHLQGLKKGGLFEDIVIVHESPVLADHVTKNSNLNIRAPQRDHIRFRNLKCLLLEKERLEGLGKTLPWRLAFYLGSETRPLHPERSVEHLTDYIKKSEWDEERAQARFYIGQIREMQMRHEEAWDHFAGATFDFPGNPMPWFGMARVAFVRGDWKKVIELSENGFTQVGDDIARKPSLVLAPIEWQYRAHLTYSRALIEMGRFEDARKSCETGLLAEPNCRYLREHLAMAEIASQKQQSGSGSDSGLGADGSKLEAA